MKKIILSISLVVILTVAVSGIIYFIPKERLVNLDLLVVDKDIADLANDSAVIAVGEVKDILPSKKTINKYTGDTILFTDIVLSVTETMKGNKSNEIVVRLPGGTFGEGKEKLTVITSDVPEFIAGEKVLVFLSKSSDGFFDLPEGYYTVDGWFQGKYQIVNGEARNPKGTYMIDELKNKIHSTLRAQ